MDLAEVDVAVLELDESNPRRSSATGLVTAGIWLRMSLRDFPAPGWDDFVVVVLGWWADVSVQLLRGGLSTARVDFMDGPYHVEITPLAPNEWHLLLVESRVSRQIEEAVRVDAGQLVASLIAASARILTTCQQRGWESRDSQRLAALLPMLRDQAERHGFARG